MEKTDVIIVLGHRLLPGNLPSDDLKRRIDRAVALWRETGAPLIMPCGGLTHERERTEAEVMKEMLVERGVPEDIIQLEDKSRVTLENMLNAFDLIGPDKRVAVVSSDYHMDMAMNDCRAVGLNAYGVGAETPDAAYRDAMRERLNSFAQKQNEMRAQGVTNRQMIDMFMQRAKEAHAKGIRLEDELQKRQ
ncbi:MAG: YdcF family protein [Clostridia bacterium]|nr:YdcF family protein [Clostridia bacterium]